MLTLWLSESLPEVMSIKLCSNMNQVFFLFCFHFNICWCTLLNPVPANGNDSESSMAGIYFGKPRGFGTNDNGEETGFNTEVYSASEVTPPTIRYSVSTIS